MIGKQLNIQGKLKPIERWFGTLKKHIGQTNIYFKYKGKKPSRYEERLQYLTAGTERTPLSQGVRCGTVTVKAAVIASPPPLLLLLTDINLFFTRYFVYA